MKIAIIGAGGNLGRYTVPALLRAGHTVRLIDHRPLETEHEFALADVRDESELRRALDGCEAIVHAAALHGIHLNKWSPADFWAINATGTFHVYEAARSLGIRKVVLSSTMGVYGDSLRAAPGEWGYAHESLPLRPTDVYGLSKVIAEETGALAGRRGEIETVALRFGMFVPESSLERYGVRLLFGGVDDRDVAQAVERAIAYTPEDGFEAFNVMAPVPFGRDDLADLHRDFESKLAHAYPGAPELLREHAIDPATMVWWPVVWDTTWARERLGYRPRYGFREFLTALRTGDRSHYEVVGLPWWGI